MDKKSDQNNPQVIVTILILVVISLSYLWWQAKETVNKQFDALNKIVEKTTKQKIDGGNGQEEWKIYNNDKYGYSMNIPSIYGPDLLEGAMYDLDNALEKAKSSDNLALFDWTDCEGETLFNVAAAQNSQELLCSQLQKESNCQFEDTTFSGLKAKKFSCEKKISQDEEDFYYVYSKQEGVCFEKNDAFYEISLDIKEREVSEEMFEIFNASSDLFKKVLAGFKFSKN